MHLTFTIDLEEHRPDESYPKRFPAITREILAFLGERKLKATVFVLGRVAESEPDLVREIATQGHEIGFHSYAHVHLDKDSPARFKQESIRSKAFIEDLIGQRVYGFRAPAFSLTARSLWVLDMLMELDFTYSSSILPANNPINGYPGAPARPFLWPNGLIEIPAPVARLGPLVFPYLGGIYLRYLPATVINHFIRSEKDRRSLWLYCHPHDFDHEEAYYTIEGTSRLTSILLWFNRRHTYRKIEAILAANELTASTPFIEQINAGVYKTLDTFTPACETHKA